MPRPYRGIQGPNRSVEMKMKPGKQFENFYWMEGPLQGDKGSRITVLHQGQEQQCSHCLKRGNCPGGGNGKACLLLKTPRGQIAEYMKYLKFSHNYISLKMKYKMKQEQEFPALSRRNVEDDGFGHMVEEEIEECEDPTEEQSKKEENILKVDPTDSDYDETTNTVKPKNSTAFEKMIDEHPTVNKLKRDNQRDKKVASLKAKVLDTLKVKERRNRDLSCESIKSDCSDWEWDDQNRERTSSTGSRGKTRPRSEDDQGNADSKKPQNQRKPVLQPPKIILSQN